MEVPFTTTEDGGIITTSNNMNSKINKRFAQLPENLRLNGVTPSGKPRLFVCDTCTRAFARQEHLIRHKRSHTNEKPYICGICNRRFSRRDLLLRHAHKLHGGNCGDMLGRKGSAVAVVAASAHSSSGGRRLNSVVSKRRRAAAATAAAADGEGVLVTSSPSMTTGSSGRSSVASVRVCKPVVKRRISFSAQSGDNYASAGSLDGPAPIKGDKVQFSTPQLLPVDLTQELSAFTPVDANSWVNDVNSISLEAVAMTGADSSGSTVTSARHSTSSISWQSGRMKSLFNNTPFQPKGVAAAAAATTAAGAGHSMATGQALGPADWQAGVDSRSPTATSLFNGAINNSSESQGGHHKGRGSPSRSREMSDCSATNEFRFLCPTETADDDSKKKSNHDDNEEDDAHNDHRGITTANDFLSTFDNFMQNGYSFYGMEVPDMANTIITSSAHPAVAAAASSGASTVCTGRGSPATSTVHCSFFTQELRAMCINALEYYSLYCVNPGTSTGSSVSVPSCRELNLYLSLFVDHFTCHSPFVHPQLWQSDLATFRGYIYGSLENASMADDRVVQYSNIVCLPLFTATMGSLYADARGTRSSAQDGANAQAGAASTSAFSSSSRAEQMYEISRRVLHVYLDTRNSAKLPSSSNLWLTQSLTLSILYSLFLESWHEISEKHSNTLLKQVNAVCTMVRKDLVPTTSSISQVPHFACQAQYIFFESKIRTIIHCYNICQMLKCFYNIKSTTFLKESDLDPLLIPDDEPTWNSAALCFHTHTDPNSILTTTSTTREKKNTMQFSKFYQTFTFSTLGAHVIPEFLTKAMLYYEFNNNSNYSFHIFLTKIDTKKLELNLRFYGGNLSGSGNVTPTSVSSDNSMPTAYNSHLQLDPTKSLSQDAVVLKNTLMCIIFFNSINPGLGWQMGCQSVDLIFETYLDSNKFNILAHGSYKLITDFLVALNFSIQNISSVIQTSQAPIFDVSRISVLNLQCYYFNFLVIIKFIMDFECTPNFKLLCIYTELKKLANSFYIPVLSSFYPLEFAKFLDSDMELLNLWKSGGAGSPSNYYHQDHQDCRLDGATASSSNTAQHINVSQLEKLINNVLVYSFNDSNFLSMPENGCNQFAFYSDPSNQSGSSNNNNHTLPMSPPSPSPRPTASSLNLLKYHQESHRTGKRLKQSFTERYHLGEKYIIIAKCIFLHAHESYVHSNFLKGFSDNFQSLERLLSKRDNNHNNNENNNNSDNLHQGNQENDNNGGVSAADGLLLMDHGSTLSGVKPSSLFSNHIPN